MASRYINMNKLPSDESQNYLNTVMTAGGMLSKNTTIIIGVIILFVGLALFYYFYYIAPSSKTSYQPNNEHMPSDGTYGKTAELLFFYADWCPHCKAAKPIWNDMKSEYESKTINGYKVIFVDVDCSEESPEVEKLMNQYSIEGYPTIKLIKDGQVIEYDAKPSKEVLTKFLNTVLA